MINKLFNEFMSYLLIILTLTMSFQGCKIEHEEKDPAKILISAGWVDENGNPSANPTGMYMIDSNNKDGKTTTFFSETEEHSFALFSLKMTEEEVAREGTFYYKDFETYYPDYFLINGLKFLFAYNELKTGFNVIIQYTDDTGKPALEVLENIEYDQAVLSQKSQLETELAALTDEASIKAKKYYIKNLILYSTLDKTLQKAAETGAMKGNRCPAVVVALVIVVAVVVFVCAVALAIAASDEEPSRPTDPIPPPPVAPPPQDPEVLQSAFNGEFGETSLGQYRLIENTIANVGAEDLLLQYASAAAGTSDSFSIDNINEVFNSPIPYDTDRTAQFKFSPLEPGPAEGIIRIYTNDIDHLILDYELSGTGIGSKFVLKINGNEVNDKAVGIDFGSKDIYTAATEVLFSIENQGNRDLSFVTSTILQNNTTDFTLDTSALSGTISPGNSELFTLGFHPASTGDKSVTITIPNNDYRYELLAPYFTLKAVGRGTYTAETEINVRQDGNNITSGDIYYFDTVILLDYATVTFTIENIGEADLNIGNISISNSIDFYLLPRTLPFTIPPEEEESITVTFAPYSIGEKTAILTINSNDASESTYLINLSGKGDNIITFPDTAFESSIRTVLGKLTGDIYQSELEELTTLNLGSKNISNIDGIEYCINLEILYLDNNNIADITPISGLTNLIYLNLDNNPLFGVLDDLAGLTQLTVLAVGATGANNLNFISNFTLLEELYAGGNSSLSDISQLALLPNLRRAFFGGCRIFDPSPLDGHLFLTHVSFRYNLISDISSMSNLPALEVLDITHNGMDLTPGSANRAVVDMYLGNGVTVDYIEGNGI